MIRWLVFLLGIFTGFHRRLKTEILGFLVAKNFDFAERGFIFLDVLLQRAHEGFGVLRRHDDARLHPRLRRAGKEPHEIDHKLCGRVIDDGEIGVDAFRLFFAQLDVDLLLLLLNIITHAQGSNKNSLNDTDFGVESQTNYKEVRTLVNEFQGGAGFKSVIWDGRDNFGNKAASAIYIYRLLVEAAPAHPEVYVISRKMMLVE